jgi:hypothetical protein
MAGTGAGASGNVAKFGDELRADRFGQGAHLRHGMRVEDGDDAGAGIRAQGGDAIAPGEARSRS